MSFFDEGDEPGTAISTEPPPRARRSSGRSGRPSRRRADERTVLARRAGAIGIAIVVVAIVVFGIRAYLSSQETQALKNYAEEVDTTLGNDETQAAQPFFTSLDNVAGQSGQALIATQSDLQEDAVTAQQEATTAAGWSVPGPVSGAQQDLLLVLDLRYEAMEKVASSIMPAIQDQGTSETAAIEDIAGDMQMIQASDVIYTVRVAPLIEQALTRDGIQVAATGAGGVSLGGISVYNGAFLPSYSWTTTGYVSGKILGSTPPSFGGTLGPGPHGHAVTAVLVGSTSLASSGINDIPYSKNMTFTIEFTNNGATDEFDVHTQITLSSLSTGTLTTTQTTRVTLPGQSYSATLGFPTAPPIGVPLKLTATVLPVPGQTDFTASTQSYYVQFQH